MAVLLKPVVVYAFYNSVTFSPGDRVTVWQEKFYCPHCIDQVCSAPNVSSATKKNTFQSPLSVTDDEGCISASDIASPHYVPEQFTDSNQPHNNYSCISSTGLPQKSRSILRRPAAEKNGLHASKERGYLSTDSGLGERVCDSSTLDESNLRHFSNEYSDQDRASIQKKSLTLCLSIYPDKVSPVPNNNRYKRNVSSTALSSYSQPRQFHLPEPGKSRFLPPGLKLWTTLFGRSTSSAIPPYTTSTPRSNNLTNNYNNESNNNNGIITSRSLNKPIASSAVNLSDDRTKSDKSTATATTKTTRISSGTPVNGHTNPLSPNSVYMNGIHHSGPIILNDHELTLETRKLACLPAGQLRDKSVPAPIERYDWPAPPASGVVLAELMRERRQRRRERARLSGTQFSGDPDDLESQEALSIDYSFDGVPDTITDNSAAHTGIGQAILREEAESKRRSRSQTYLDPVSASRTPSAAVEPSFKPRYATHQFALLNRESATTMTTTTSISTHHNNISRFGAATMPTSTTPVISGHT
ncbi:unnamed protein product [Heterobilharzia americana]|nr:unnamed protein product [Heterobilharzia americana]